MATVTDSESTRPKRGNGEGTVAKRPDGIWVGQVMLGRKANGKPDRPKVYGNTREQVRRQLAKLKREYDEGKRIDPAKERQTVAEFMATWLDAARTSTRPQTWAGYAHIIRNHIVPALGRQKLKDLRPDAIQRLYADKLSTPQQTNHNKPLTPLTVRKIHIVLHRALEMAVKWDYIARNPADAADRPSVPTRDMQALDPAELNRLIDCALADGERPGYGDWQARSAKQWAMLWMLAIHTGLREGELLALAWSDLDLDRGTLTVRRNLVRTRNHAPTFGEPKSHTSRRTISLPAVTIQALRAHKARQAEDHLSAADWADYNLVFCTHVGTPLMRRNVLRAFKLALERAGLPASVHFHDLRHAHATLMLRAGVPIKTASARLGHSGISITGDLYQHVAGDMDMDAASRAAAILDASRTDCTAIAPEPTIRAQAPGSI